MASDLKGCGKVSQNQSARPKDEVLKEIQQVLSQNRVLQIEFFDFRVRQYLHALFGTGGRPRLRAALAMVHARTLHRTKQDVKNWPAYLVTLLKNFDPDKATEEWLWKQPRAETALGEVNSALSSASTTPPTCDKTDHEGDETESSKGEADDSFDETQRYLREQGKLLQKEIGIQHLATKLQEKQDHADHLEKKLEEMQATIDNLLGQLVEKKADAQTTGTRAGEERWQFQGDDGEWRSFPDDANSDWVAQWCPSPLFWVQGVPKTVTSPKKNPKKEGGGGAPIS